MKFVVATCLLFKFELKWKSDWKLRLLNRHPASLPLSLYNALSVEGRFN